MYTLCSFCHLCYLLVNQGSILLTPCRAFHHRSSAYAGEKNWLIVVLVLAIFSTFDFLPLFFFSFTYWEGSCVCTIDALFYAVRFYICTDNYAKV